MRTGAHVQLLAAVRLGGVACSRDRAWMTALDAVHRPGWALCIASHCQKQTMMTHRLFLPLQVRVVLSLPVISVREVAAAHQHGYEEQAHRDLPLHGHASRAALGVPGRA